MGTQENEPISPIDNRHSSGQYYSPTEPKRSLQTIILVILLGFLLIALIVFGVYIFKKSSSSSSSQEKTGSESWPAGTTEVPFSGGESGQELTQTLKTDLYGITSNFSETLNEYTTFPEFKTPEGSKLRKVNFSSAYGSESFKIKTEIGFSVDAADYKQVHQDLVDEFNSPSWGEPLTEPSSDTFNDITVEEITTKFANPDKKLDVIVSQVRPTETFVTIQYEIIATDPELKQTYLDRFASWTDEIPWPAGGQLFIVRIEMGANNSYLTQERIFSDEVNLRASFRYDEQISKDSPQSKLEEMINCSDQVKFNKENQESHEKLFEEINKEDTLVQADRIYVDAEGFKGESYYSYSKSTDRYTVDFNYQST